MRKSPFRSLSKLSPGVIDFNGKMKMDVVDLVSYQNSVSKKIHDADRNRFYNSITN